MAARLEATTVQRIRKADLVPGYQLESLLGRGGMGEVHKAIQLSLNRTVAVKILSSELAKDPQFVARFEKEAAALATLSHPNIVDIVDKGHTGDTWYLVMEYIDGPSLREVMRSPLLEPGSSLRMVFEICRGMEYAHGRGVVHRDLKPENILFDEQAGGIPKVTDFGLAAFVERAAQTSRFNVTETHVAMGTASYMAPEQRIDARMADHRADIYSLGVILYELLVGELPVGNFALPSQRKPGVDPKVDAIVARCLKQNPAERYQKISELVTVLEPLAPVTKTSFSKRTGPAARILSRVKRTARIAGRVAVAALVLAAAGVLVVDYVRDGKPSGDPFPGAAVTAELEAGEVLTVPGRVNRDGPRRNLAIGEGPDTIPLLTFGRDAELDAATVVSPASFRKRAARIEPDVLLDGDSIALHADVEAERGDRGFLGFIRRAVYGEPPPARAALMLLGSAGRFAAASVSRNGGAVAFEYALGERRGVMLGPASPEDARAPLSVEVDEDGALQAFVGEGADRRAIGEPVRLGEDWRRHFGGSVRPALGCLDGTCRFRQVRERATVPVAAPAAPEPPPTVASAPAKPPRPAVRKASPKPSIRRAGAASTKRTPVKKRR